MSKDKREHLEELLSQILIIFTLQTLIGASLFDDKKFLEDLLAHDYLFRHDDEKDQLLKNFNSMVKGVKDMVGKEGFNANLHYQYQVMNKKMALNSTFELIKEYCKRKGHETMMKQADWYPVALIYRNIASHHINNNGVIWPKELKVEEVTWKSRVLKKGMRGKDAKINSEDCIELFLEEMAWVLKELS